MEAARGVATHPGKEASHSNPLMTSQRAVSTARMRLGEKEGEAEEEGSR